MCAEGYSERLYPIGALSEKEAVDVRLDPLCSDSVGIDELLEDWRAKSSLYGARPRPPPNATNSDLLPLELSPATRAQVGRMLFSYRVYLPTRYEVALVPISKLVTPQRHVVLDYIGAAFAGAQGPLTDDENAAQCLGLPVRDPKMDAVFLGYDDSDQRSEDLVYLYQFSSEDNNIRVIPTMPLKPFQDVDLAADGAPERYRAKAVAVPVGPGLSFVHVLKVPLMVDPATGQTAYRLIIGNGVHRVFRLLELGNTHAAAVVQTLQCHELPETYVEVPRDALLGPSPLRMTDLADRHISRVFQFKKARRVIKLRVRVSQEISYAP